MTASASTPSLLLRQWRPGRGLPLTPSVTGEGLDLRVEDGCIAAIGRLEPRPQEPVVDLDGGVLVPGLIDAHVHLGIGERREFRPLSVPEPPSSPAAVRGCIDAGREDAGAATRRFLANARATLDQGVTAVRTLGNVLERDIGEMLPSLSSDPYFPRVVSAGRALTRQGRYGGFLGRSLRDGVDLAEAAAREIEGGAAVLKVILSGGVDFETGAVDGPFFTLEELRPVVTLAREHGVPVAAHANGPAAIAVALRAEVDTLEHGILIGPAELDLLADGPTRWVPTLTPLARLLGAPGTASLPVVLADHREAVGQAAASGVRVLAGSDSGCRGVPHSCLWDELRLLEEAGLPPAAVASSVTREAAEALALSDGYGCLAPGARTDLVWFARDPFFEDPGPPLGMVRAGVVRGGGSA